MSMFGALAVEAVSEQIVEKINNEISILSESDGNEDIIIGLYIALDIVNTTYY